MRFRFIGTSCAIGEVAGLREFGEAVDLDATLAKDIIGHPRGAALLPEATFSTLGFTEGELSEYATPGSHIDAPPTFQAKKSAALIALNDLRAWLARGGDFNEGGE